MTDARRRATTPIRAPSAGPGRWPARRAQRAPPRRPSCRGSRPGTEGERSRAGRIRPPAPAALGPAEAAGGSSAAAFGADDAIGGGRAERRRRARNVRVGELDFRARFAPGGLGWACGDAGGLAGQGEGRGLEADHALLRLPERARESARRRARIAPAGRCLRSPPARRRSAGWRRDRAPRPRPAGGALEASTP